MRIWVRVRPKMGASQPWGTGSPSRLLSTCVFKARRRSTGRHPPAALYGSRVTSTLSLCEWLPGPRRLKQKRKLFPGPPPVSAGFFPLPGPCISTPACSVDLPGLSYGILTVFPFASELPTGNCRPSVRRGTAVPGPGPASGRRGGTSNIGCDDKCKAPPTPTPPSDLAPGLGPGFQTDFRAHPSTHDPRPRAGPTALPPLRGPANGSRRCGGGLGARGRLGIASNHFG